ncbi:SH3 domain-containing protein [Mycena rebaudengoi]|nr:SH3 domain-containing protein [Mycena rebaudengoi]
MTVHRSSSTTSLSRYATAKSPGVDPYNGSRSREFCNSFWGQDDDGVNVLFARMRGAARATEDLRNFWKERAAIEEEYATRLAALGKASLGRDEIGEMRNSFDTLRFETEKQAASHLQFASQIRSELATPITTLLKKQIDHHTTVQIPLEKRFKARQTQKSDVFKAQEKYENDYLRIASYTQQISTNDGPDMDRLQAKLRRAQQAIHVNERDFSNFNETVLETAAAWETDWKDFCDACQDFEEARLELMNNIIFTYANDVSTLCVSDDQSCERIRTALDQMDAARDVKYFVEEYGTGNSIPEPAIFMASTLESAAKLLPGPRTARFVRRTERAPEPSGSSIRGETDTHRAAEQDTSHTNGTAHSGHHRSHTQHKPSSTRAHREEHTHRAAEQDASRTNGTAHSGHHGSHTQHKPSSTRAHREEQAHSKRMSMPLPPTPGPVPQYQPHGPAPPLYEGKGPILFYVKAIFDYTATIDEEFDFQVGDIIAVTATPEDGWWSGELLDEARRQGGRHVFPSNFVCLF